MQKISGKKKKKEKETNKQTPTKTKQTKILESFSLFRGSRGLGGCSEQPWQQGFPTLELAALVRELHPAR